MLDFLAPGSPATIAILAGCFILVLFFEFSNGFHDTANAVATVIYTNSLRPIVAVVWSGILNFVGVIVGGIAVAYALVELILRTSCRRPTEVARLACLSRSLRRRCSGTSAHGGSGFRIRALTP